MMHQVKNFVVSILACVVAALASPIMNDAPTYDDVGMPMASNLDLPPSAFLSGGYHLGDGIHKRSVGSDATVFSMSQDMNNQVDWDVVDPSANDYVHDSRAAFNIIGNTNPECPTTVADGASDPIYKRSTCPWYYVAKHDANRFPTTMLQAKQLCNTCIGSNGQFECVGITHTTKVLRRGAFNETSGTHTWTEAEELQTIGFTCAGRRMADTGSSATQAPSLPEYA